MGQPAKGVMCSMQRNPACARGLFILISVVLTAAFVTIVACRGDTAASGTFILGIRDGEPEPRALTAGAEIGDELIPGGHTTGIKVFMDGVMVVGFTRVGDSSPAIEAGLREGDMIKTLNGKKVETVEMMAQFVNDSRGKGMSLGIDRGGEMLSVSLRPVLDTNDGEYKIGAWVRDSMAGIGTITFYDPKSGVYGALGHGINDVDTGRLLPLRSGSLMNSKVESVKKGAAGNPGELRGSFDLTKDSGSLEINSDSGIFGRMYDDSAFTGRKPIKVAKASEVKVGDAIILSNIDGDKIEEFSVEIVKIYEGKRDSRDMMIRINEDNAKLLKVAGGIVQGMSGSPIIQNGKLIGALTHVTVSDPKRGYGVFIERMLNEAAELPSYEKAA